MKTGMTMSRLAAMAGVCVGCALGALAAPPVTDGLKFWVDASDASSVTTNAGGLVAQWNDLSGTGNHVAQTTDSAKPVYNPAGLDGKPSLSFNSTNILFKSGGVLCYSNHTAFLVAKATAYTENDMLASGGTGAGDILVMHYTVSGNNLFRGHYWGASGVATKDSAIKTAVAVPLVYAQRMNGTALEIFRNGTRDAIQPYSSFSANKKGIILGYRSTGGSSGKCFAGELSEVLIYERALSEGERAQVEEYLTEKWLGDYAPIAATPVTAGLKFRLDAGVRQSILTNAAGKVIQCLDLSGSGYHLQQQATSSKQPSYTPDGLCGKPALSFNGTNVLVTTASTINYSNHTVFVVAKATDVNTGNGNDLLGANMSVANGFLLNLFSYRYWGTYWPTNSTPASSVPLGSTAPVTFGTTLYEQRLDDAGLEVFRGGVSEGSAPVGARTNLLNGVSLGYRTDGVNNGDGFFGQVAEVLIYDRALSAEERVQVESHLTNKWFAGDPGVPVSRNLKFRVDASDAASVVTNELGKVSKWWGRGETGYYVTQTTTNKQPTYNPHGLRWRPSLSFNGTNVMSLPFNAINYSNHTVFVVAHATSGSSAKDFLGSGGTAPGDILLMNYNNKYRGHYFPSTNISAWLSLDSVSATVLTPVIYGQTLSDTGFRIYRNGVLDNTKTTGLSYTNVLRSVILGSRQAGGSDYFVGEMSEVLIYDCALTDEERQEVEVYLREKWLRDRRGTMVRVR